MISTEAFISPAVHPMLMVQTAFESLHGERVEVVPHVLACDPLRHHIMLVLQTSSAADSIESRLYAETLANALAVHFLRRYAVFQHTVRVGASGLTPAMLRRVLAYIHAHLQDALPLATLATVVQLSPNHFARLFKQATGRTPHHYILECRLARAQQLLAETDLPLSNIAFQVGWPDQSYITSLFRFVKWTGLVVASDLQSSQQMGGRYAHSEQPGLRAQRNPSQYASRACGL